MEKRILKGHTLRRQETNGKGQETRKAHNAATVEDDVAIHENNDPVVYTHAAPMVRATAPTHRSRHNCSVSPLAWPRPNAIQRDSLVPSLLLPSRHNLQSPTRPRTRRRLTMSKPYQPTETGQLHHLHLQASPKRAARGPASV